MKERRQNKNKSNRMIMDAAKWNKFYHLSKPKPKPAVAHLNANAHYLMTIKFEYIFCSQNN